MARLRGCSPVTPRKPKRGRPAGTTAVTDSLFAKWRTALGLGGAKQVGEAGELLGLPVAAASRRNRGTLEADYIERLAMSAVRAGLPPWSPKADREIAAVARRRRSAGKDHVWKVPGFPTMEAVDVATHRRRIARGKAPPKAR